MTLAKAFTVFDSIAMDAPDRPDAIGTVRCCGLPVVMTSDSEGRPRIYCLKCRRTIGELARQWLILNWGTRGIKLPEPEVLA
jgi:hypothetical protein